MPTYIVTSPDGKEYEVDAPEGATQEQALDYFKSNWQQPATQSAKTQQDPQREVYNDPIPGSGMDKNILDLGGSILGGARDVLSGAVRGAGSIGATAMRVLPNALGGDTAEENEQRRRDMDAALKDLVGADTESTSYTLGKIGGEIAGTAGVAGGLARLAALSGKVSPSVLNALQSGGLSTKAPGFTGPLPQGGKLMDYATRVGAGAGVGGVAAGMANPDDAVIGAGIGAALPGVVQPALPYVGKLVDKASEFSSLESARKILQEIAGGDKAAMAAKARQAQGVTTAQALEEFNNPSMAGLQAITRSMNPESAQFYTDLARRQAVEQTDTMVRMAGGASSEDAAIYRDLLRKHFENQLAPKRMAMLDSLAASNKQLEELKPMLSDVERRYISASQNQWRMATEAGAAISPVTARGGLVPNPQTAALQGERVPAMVRGVGEQPKPIYPSQQFTDAADEFGGIAQQLRGEADALRQAVSEASKGTFTAQPVRDLVASIASNPATAMNSVKQTVINKVAEKLAIVGNDPALLAEFRRMGVNDLLGDMAAGVDKATKQAAEAELVGIKKVIDQQLGDEFVNGYLAPYAKKLAYVDSLKAMDELRLMQKDAPDQFLKTVRGDNLDFMEKYSMTAKSLKELIGPGKFNKTEKIAKEMQRDINIKELESEGRKAVGNLLKEGKMASLLPNFLNKYWTMFSKTVKTEEQNVSAKVMKKLDEAMRDPSKAADLLELAPTRERIALIKWLQDQSDAAMIGASRTAPAMIE